MSLEEAAPSRGERPRSSSGGGAEGKPAGEARSWAAQDGAHRLGLKSPSRTFRLPGGKTMTLSTDRVRATPAVSPQISFMLGQNAIGLGLWGLLAPKGVNRFLGLRSSPQTTQLLFGAREMATGTALFSDPTKASALWARVAGDVFDIVVLSRLARPDNPKRGNARMAMGVVLAVAALDLVAAFRMTNVKRNWPRSA